MSDPGSLSSSAPVSGAFAENELVLIPFGPLIYEAKILKCMATKGPGGVPKTSYFIHYNGWSPKFDEWVEASRLMKDNQENRELQKLRKIEIKRQKEEADNAKKAKKAGRGSGSVVKRGVDDDGLVGRGKKRQRQLEGDSTVEFEIPAEDGEGADEENANRPKVEIQLKLPGILKKQLLTDWENVTRSQLCVTLPRSPSVRDILAQFASSTPRSAVLEFKSLGLGDSPASNTLVNELNQAIINYFDRSCGVMLLYRMEKPQFEDFVLADRQEASQIYGAEHLLRLFVKLPDMMSQSRRLRESDIKLLQAHCNDLLNFMGQRVGNMFTELYEPVDEKYLKRVQA